MTGWLSCPAYSSAPTVTGSAIAAVIDATDNHRVVVRDYFTQPGGDCAQGGRRSDKNDEIGDGAILQAICQANSIRKLDSGKVIFIFTGFSNAVDPCRIIPPERNVVAFLRPKHGQGRAPSARTQNRRCSQFHFRWKRGSVPWRRRETFER